MCMQTCSSIWDIGIYVCVWVFCLWGTFSQILLWAVLVPSQTRTQIGQRGGREWKKVLDNLHKVVLCLHQKIWIGIKEWCIPILWFDRHKGVTVSDEQRLLTCFTKHLQTHRRSHLCLQNKKETQHKKQALHPHLSSSNYKHWKSHIYRNLWHANIINYYQKGVMLTVSLYFRTSGERQVPNYKKREGTVKDATSCAHIYLHLLVFHNRFSYKKSQPSLCFMTSERCSFCNNNKWKNNKVVHLI